MTFDEFKTEFLATIDLDEYKKRDSYIQSIWENGGKPFIRSEIKTQKGMFDKTAFADFLKQLNPDTHEMTGVPRFVDAANRDYRLAPDSVGYGKNIGANPKVTQ